MNKQTVRPSEPATEQVGHDGAGPGRVPAPESDAGNQAVQEQLGGGRCTPRPWEELSDDERVQVEEIAEMILGMDPVEWSILRHEAAREFYERNGCDLPMLGFADAGPSIDAARLAVLEARTRGSETSILEAAMREVDRGVTSGQGEALSEGLRRARDEVPEGGACAVPEPAHLDPSVPDIELQEAMRRAGSGLVTRVQEELAGEHDLRGFLIAGHAGFGSYSAALEHFSASNFRTAGVPGSPLVHRDTAGHLEAAVAALPDGVEAPEHTAGFSMRRGDESDFTAGFGFHASNMHALGYAIDYRTRDNPHMRPRDDGSEHAMMVQVVTGEANNLELGDWSDRRGIGREMGAAACVGEPHTDAQEAHLDRILEEIRRVEQVSATFQQSLGADTDAFLDVRTRYFEAETDEDEQAVLAEARALIAPWYEAIDREQAAFVEVAGAAGYDVADLPSARTLRRRVEALEELAEQVEEARRTRVEAEAELAAWEAELGMETSGTLAERLTELALEARTRREDRSQDREHRSRLREIYRGAEATAGDVEDVDALLNDWEALCGLPAQGGVDERLDAVSAAIPGRVGPTRALRDRLDLEGVFDSLREHLDDPRFLFGRQTEGPSGRPTTRQDVRAPSMAQLVEHGFFNLDDTFGELFLQSVARHGFDLGAAWEDEGQDSMHVELIVPMPSRSDARSRANALGQQLGLVGADEE